MSWQTSRLRLHGRAVVVVATLLWSRSAVAIASLLRDGMRPLQLVQLRVYITAIGLHEMPGSSDTEAGRPGDGHGDIRRRSDGGYAGFAMA